LKILQSATFVKSSSSKHLTRFINTLRVVSRPCKVIGNTKVKQYLEVMLYSNKKMLEKIVHKNLKLIKELVILY